MGRALAKPITPQNHVMGIAALHPSCGLWLVFSKFKLVRWGEEGGLRFG